MKRFTVLTALLSISIVATWAISQAVSAPKSSNEAKVDNAPVLVYDSTGTMLKAIHAGDGYQVVQVYDATGAMLKAIHAGDNYQVVPVTGATTTSISVYDATGTMLKVVHGGDGYQTAPVYDATGAMLEAINP